MLYVSISLYLKNVQTELVYQTNKCLQIMFACHRRIVCSAIVLTQLLMLVLYISRNIHRCILTEIQFLFIQFKTISIPASVENIRSIFKAQTSSTARTFAIAGE